MASNATDPNEAIHLQLQKCKKKNKEMKAEIERLRDQIKQLQDHRNRAWAQSDDLAPRDKKDAKRYRWGLEHPALMANHFIKWRSKVDHYNCRNTGVHPSDAIDAAMKEDKG